MTLIQQLSRTRSVADNQSPFLAEARYLLKQTGCSVEWQAESRNNYAWGVVTLKFHVIAQLSFLQCRYQPPKAPAIDLHNFLIRLLVAQ